MDFLKFLTDLGLNSTTNVGILAFLSLIFWFFVSRGGQFISKLIFAFFKREKDLEVREMNIELKEYFDGKFTQVNNTLEHIQTDVSALKTDVSALKTDVRVLDSRVEKLEKLNPFRFLIHS